MEEAGSALRAMREALGLTLEQLATKAGCDAGYLSRVERGERNPSRYFLAHLAYVLADGEDAA